ncbi:hypothetical protein KPB2_5574 [Klebsiella pneumoniae Kb677]|nr:hypothetical protein KPB2_5574 [Klebsiella pneumoniae Kb677]
MALPRRVRDVARRRAALALPCGTAYVVGRRSQAAASGVAAVPGPPPKVVVVVVAVQVGPKPVVGRCRLPRAPPAAPHAFLVPASVPARRAGKGRAQGVGVAALVAEGTRPVPPLGGVAAGRRASAPRVAAVGPALRVKASLRLAGKAPSSDVRAQATRT